MGDEKRIAGYPLFSKDRYNNHSCGKRSLFNRQLSQSRNCSQIFRKNLSSYPAGTKMPLIYNNQHPRLISLYHQSLMIVARGAINNCRTAVKKLPIPIAIRTDLARLIIEALCYFGNCFGTRTLFTQRDLQHCGMLSRRSHIPLKYYEMVPVREKTGRKCDGYPIITLYRISRQSRRKMISDMKWLHIIIDSGDNLLKRRRPSCTSNMAIVANKRNAFRIAFPHNASLPPVSM